MLYLLLTIVLAVPLFFNLLGGHLVAGHDATAGLVRAMCMQQDWGQGGILPRWCAEPNFGYGSPMFDFYPPFFYYLVLFISKIVPDTLLAMNLACIFLWVLSGVGMFLLARELWGEKGGFLSGILYIYAPYYVQDLYVRGAFAEFAVFTPMPFLLLSLYKLSRKVQTRYVLLGVLSATAAVLTHGMGIFFVIIAVLYVFLVNKGLQKIFLGLFVPLTGSLMAAFYWLAAAVETKYLNLNFLIGMRYDFHANFISWGQLLVLPWDVSASRDGLSFQLGVVPLLLLLLSLVAFFRVLRKEPLLWKHYVLFFAVALAAVLMTLPVSESVWESVHSLRFIQLPWRFLTIAVFAISLLAGSSLMLFKTVRIQGMFLAVAVLLVMLSPLGYYTAGGFKNIDQAAFREGISSYMLLGEGDRTPQWIQTPPLAVPPQKFQILHGNGELSGYRADSPVDHSVQVQAGEPLLVCFHTFYFPGWKVLVDGQETQIHPDNPYGVILFVVPPGRHALRVVFGSTPVRDAGAVLSWLGLVFLIIGVLWSRKLKLTG